MKSDLWKDKCRELFDICKDLEKENEQLKGLVTEANQAHLLNTAEEAERSAGAHSMQPGLPGVYQGPAAKSTGPGSIGVRSNLGGSRGGERVLSNRTLGMPGTRGAARREKLAGGATLASGPSYPSVRQSVPVGKVAGEHDPSHF
jgi:hypothetical protein